VLVKSIDLAIDGILTCDIALIDFYFRSGIVNIANFL